MVANLSTWEKNLLQLAQEAHHRAGHKTTINHAEDAPLIEAYDYCEKLTARYSRSFFLASELLPVKKRRAIRALYAFCRITDDIVDNPGPSPEYDLNAWKRRALTNAPAPHDLVALAWADTRARYHIPSCYAEQLIDGVNTDLHKTRYETFEELAAYAYGVASTVGLMSMHIIGYAGKKAIPYAIKLGVALQLTNILRDVGEDWANDRIYLPREELAQFHLSERDIARGIVDNRWRAFMRYQIIRNRRLYTEAMPGIGMLNRKGRLAITAAADFYAAILNAIEANDYDVFHRRAYLSGTKKLAVLPKIWWRSQTLAAQ